MKVIKKYKMFLEHRNQEEVDYILDKINKSGIDSLSKIEREILDNWDNPDYEIPSSYEEDDSDTLDLNSKEGMLDYIDRKIGDYYDVPISLPGLENGITYKRYSDQIHIIKYLSNEEVIIVPLTKENKWKLDDSKSYRVPYQELHTLSLHKIIDFLEKENLK